MFDVKGEGDELEGVFSDEMVVVFEVMEECFFVAEIEVVLEVVVDYGFYSIVIVGISVGIIGEFVVILDFGDWFEFVVDMFDSRGEGFFLSNEIGGIFFEV